MAQFFKNNFAEDRWRKAALKNAFSLLGKQKFERAAAFFLLGDAVKDAVEVWTGLRCLIVASPTYSRSTGGNTVFQHPLRNTKLIIYN